MANSGIFGNSGLGDFIFGGSGSTSINIDLGYNITGSVNLGGSASAGISNAVYTAFGSIVTEGNAFLVVDRTFIGNVDITLGGLSLAGWKYVAQNGFTLQGTAGLYVCYFYTSTNDFPPDYKRFVNGTGGTVISGSSDIFSPENQFYTSSDGITIIGTSSLQQNFVVEVTKELDLNGNATSFELDERYYTGDVTKTIQGSAESNNILFFYEGSITKNIGGNAGTDGNFIPGIIFIEGNGSVELLGNAETKLISELAVVTGLIIDLFGEAAVNQNHNLYFVSDGPIVDLNGESNAVESFNFQYTVDSGIGLIGTSLLESTFNYNTFGPITLSGRAERPDFRIHETFDALITLSGSVEFVSNLNYTYSSTEGLTVSGDSLENFGINFIYETSDGISVNGEADKNTSNSLTTEGFGGITVIPNAIATPKFFKVTPNITGTKITLKGSASLNTTFIYQASGGIGPSGTSFDNLGVNYNTNVSALLKGRADIWEPIAFITRFGTAEAELSGTSDVLAIFAFIYEPSTGISISGSFERHFNAESTASILLKGRADIFEPVAFITIFGNGSITLSGDADEDFGHNFQATSIGGIKLSGIVDEPFVFRRVGFGRLTGNANIVLNVNYNANSSTPILLSGTFTQGLTAEGSGGLTLSGTYAQAFTYIPKLCLMHFVVGDIIDVGGSALISIAIPDTIGQGPISLNGSADVTNSFSSEFVTGSVELSLSGTAPALVTTLGFSFVGNGELLLKGRIANPPRTTFVYSASREFEFVTVDLLTEDKVVPPSGSASFGLTSLTINLDTDELGWHVIYDEPALTYDLLYLGLMLAKEGENGSIINLSHVTGLCSGGILPECSDIDETFLGPLQVFPKILSEDINDFKTFQPGISSLLPNFINNEVAAVLVTDGPLGEVVEIRDQLSFNAGGCFAGGVATTIFGLSTSSAGGGIVVNGSAAVISSHYQMVGTGSLNLSGQSAPGAFTSFGLLISIGGESSANYSIDYNYEPTTSITLSGDSDVFSPQIQFINTSGNLNLSGSANQFSPQWQTFFSNGSITLDTNAEYIDPKEYKFRRNNICSLRFVNNRDPYGPTALISGVKHYNYTASPEVGFKSELDGTQVIPPSGSGATGSGVLEFNPDTGRLFLRIDFTGLTGAITALRLQGPATPGTDAPILIDLVALGVPLNIGPTFVEGDFLITEIPPILQPVVNLFLSYTRNGLTYVVIGTAGFPNGEIRGHVFGNFGSIFLSANEGSDADEQWIVNVDSDVSNPIVLNSTALIGRSVQGEDGIVLNGSADTQLKISYIGSVTKTLTGCADIWEPIAYIKRIVGGCVFIEGDSTESFGFTFNYDAIGDIVLNSTAVQKSSFYSHVASGGINVSGCADIWEPILYVKRFGQGGFVLNDEADYTLGINGNVQVNLSGNATVETPFLHYVPNPPGVTIDGEALLLSLNVNYNAVGDLIEITGNAAPHYTYIADGGLSLVGGINLYIARGTFNLSGNATAEIPDRTVVTSGGFELSGNADQINSFDFIVANEGLLVSITGSSDVVGIDFAFLFVPSGEIAVLGGKAGLFTTVKLDANGTLTASGDSIELPLLRQIADTSTPLTLSGSIGFADILLRQFSDGGNLIFGSAVVTKNFFQYTAITLNPSGQSALRLFGRALQNQIDNPPTFCFTDQYFCVSQENQERCSELQFYYPEFAKTSPFAGQNRGAILPAITVCNQGLDLVTKRIGPGRKQLRPVRTKSSPGIERVLDTIPGGGPRHPKLKKKIKI